MSEQMTLEKVRDRLREESKLPHSHRGISHCNDVLTAMADAIDAHLNAAKGAAVAWRYRFAGSQEYRYATAGEELVDGRPLVESQPLYTHPAAPDVVRETKCQYIVSSKEGTQYCRLNGPPLDVVRDAERLRFIQRNYQFAVNTSGGCIEDGINLENEHIDAAMAALEGGE